MGPESPNFPSEKETTSPIKESPESPSEELPEYDPDFNPSEHVCVLCGKSHLPEEECPAE